MTKILEDLLRQGTAAARPAANAVVVGSYYFATDTGVLSQSDGSSWTTIATTTVGTVTSVALTVPAILSVAGSPITSSGTLAVTLATETANTVFAGATSGGAATPTFRALVTADLPTSGVSAGTTSGITVNTAGQVTARTALVSADLPAATSTAAGALKSPWLFAATADTTVANTTTETSLLGTGVGTKTLPANCLTAGRSVRISASGYWDYNAGGTATFRLKLGGSAVWDTFAFTPTPTGRGLWWNAEWVITCRTTGAGGTVLVQGIVRYGQIPNTVDTFYGANQFNTTTGAIDTTATQVIDFTQEWAVADPDNSITCTNALIELIG